LLRFDRSSSNDCDAKFLSGPLRVYVGSSGITYAGWHSLTALQLNITRTEHFARFFCPESVDAFLSEHTFEHLSEEMAKVAFTSFYRYLKYDGYVRTAVPDGAGQKNWPSPIDIKFGHRSFYNISSLSKLLMASGFTDIRPLEWISCEHGACTTQNTREWDICQGPVLRSVFYDSRNRDFLYKWLPTLSLGRFNRLANNSFPKNERVVSSLIVDAFKRRIKNS